MAPPVYSTRFVLLKAQQGPLSYLVPVGHRAVVTCLDAWNSGSGANAIYLQIAGMTVIRVPLAASTGTNSWRGNHTVYAGETIAAAADAPLNAMISGYLFLDSG